MEASEFVSTTRLESITKLAPHAVSLSTSGEPSLLMSPQDLPEKGPLALTNKKVGYRRLLVLEAP